MYIPDPFKVEVLRFLGSDAGKALLKAAQERAPKSPDANLPHSTKLSTYDQIAGYGLALYEILRVPHESAASPPPPPSPLFDTRD